MNRSRNGIKCVMGSIYQSIELLTKEKGIETQIVLDAVKHALLVVARKHYRTNENYIAELNEKTGSIDLFAVKKVVETVENRAGELTLLEARRLDPAAEMESEVRIPKSTDLLGRISAQTAKQVIFQKVREAERETIYQEYSGRVGELVNCTVKRIEGADLVLDLGKTEARLPKKEQSRLENYSVGDRVRCVIKAVDKSSKSPGVVISRAAPELVMRLFEQEGPETYDSTIIIKSEEEKRQEVESAMAALVAPGASVSVLIDYGLGEKLAEKLVESGVATVEKLGSMTPEDLEAIQGIGPKMVEKIQQAVNAYYGQFEAGAEPDTAAGLELGAEAGSIEEPAPEGAVEAREAEGESVESLDPVAAEGVAGSDTMEHSHSSAQSPDEKGEVHESYA